ncbi:MAG: hypothetical protein Q9191_002094 [Dirinaria sp. TL-2023a]
MAQETHVELPQLVNLAFEDHTPAKLQLTACTEAMRQQLLWLASAGLTYGSPGVFSVQDDLLAFPQYEVVFSENYILDEDARIRLTHDASRSPHQPQTAPPVTAGDEDGTKESSQIQSGVSQRDSLRHDTNAHQDPNLSSTTSSYYTMNLQSRPYLCSIPTVLPSTNTTSTPKDPEAEAAELARATDRGWELLKEMEGNCMYFISGWWSYSFCYNTAVKQFHPLPPGKGTPLYPPMEDPTTPSYVLGKYTAGKPTTQQRPPPQLDAGEGGGKGGRSIGSTTNGEKDTASPQLQAKGSVRYLVQKLQGGTTCDLTGRERKVEPTGSAGSKK